MKGPNAESQVEAQARAAGDGQEGQAVQSGEGEVKTTYEALNQVIDAEVASAMKKVAPAIHPTLDRVLVRRHEEPDSSILLTDRKKYQVCRVVAVGPGAWRDGAFCKTAVKPGDNVLIPGYGGQNPDHEFEDGSFLVQEGDIGAIVG